MTWGDIKEGDTVLVVRAWPSKLRYEYLVLSVSPEWIEAQGGGGVTKFNADTGHSGEWRVHTKATLAACEAEEAALRKPRHHALAVSLSDHFFTPEQEETIARMHACYGDRMKIEPANLPVPPPPRGCVMVVNVTGIYWKTLYLHTDGKVHTERHEVFYGNPYKRAEKLRAQAEAEADQYLTPEQRLERAEAQAKAKRYRSPSTILREIEKRGRGDW